MQAGKTLPFSTKSSPYQRQKCFFGGAHTNRASMFMTATSTSPDIPSARAAEGPMDEALGLLIAVDLRQVALVVLPVLVLLLLSVLAT